MKILLIAAMVFVLTTVAYADLGKMQGLPIKIGDTVEEVQKAFKTNIEPDEVPTTKISPFQKKIRKSQLTLKTKGVTISFENGKVTAISLNPPFSGNVDGVKLGDTLGKIEKTFGPAVKHFTFGVNEAYIYYFDDVTTTRFDVNPDEELETIRLFK